VTKLEPDLFLAVTGLTVEDFDLVRLKVFNTEQNQAVFAFRRYEDSSLSTPASTRTPASALWLYDTVVAVKTR